MTTLLTATCLVLSALLALLALLLILCLLAERNWSRRTLRERLGMERGRK